MGHRRISTPPARRRFAALLGVAVIVLLACLCPATLPGSEPATTAPAGQPTTPAGAATLPAGAETQPPGSEATPDFPATEIARTVIPPTAAVGEEYFEIFEGAIAAPGEEDTYTFTAVPGQEFFFGVLDLGREMAQVNWRAEDETGAEVFNTCMGCGNPGVYTLERGGAYTVTLGEPDSAVGPYRIVIAAVRVHYFPVTLGARLSAGQPGPGAGSLESPGARDMYSFHADAGEEVYFGVEDQEGVPLADLVVLDEEAAEVFHSCLGCGNPGVYTLQRGGTYMVVIGSDTEAATGTYVLLIEPVHTDTFTVAPGVVIGQGAPGPGAGNIETPGGRDVFTFSAAPGQQIILEVLNSGEMPLVRYQLLDEDGAEVYANCLGCGPAGTLVLERGGTYTLVVGGGPDIGTGPYELSIQPG